MPNHLAQETSPYLLQHVNNPVDWYPWGEEALSIAREQDRPIFLSIGYSACHWCHVMEHESFENNDIARLMNQWFVCIKVDREERPDLDQIYMSAVMAMTGSGGWPMSVFLTPALKPFFGGTYWPPTARWGRPGFREILAGVHDAWDNRRSAVDAQADELTNHIQQSAAPTIPPSQLGEGILVKAMDGLLRAADPVNGGFGSAPKFPHPMDVRLGLRLWKRFQNRTEQSSNSKQVRDFVLLTLDKMARGGIYDHLGGGFARYSTDERWLVPHFEKMLYDNAQLVPGYLEAFQLTGRKEFAEIARETLDYILREMTQPGGGFYSTQDADSEGVEGKFFVWSEAEIDAVLGEAADQIVERVATDSAPSPLTRSQILTAFKQNYDVSAHGNWEHSNILNCPNRLEQTAIDLSIEPEFLRAILAECRKVLFEVRSQRVWPGRDEKVLVSWNGLMIAAMSMGANVLNDARYADAAKQAADFILTKMIETPAGGEAASLGKLYHAYKDGRSRFNAYLDDYAALIDGLCELYQALFDVRYLDYAIQLADRMLEQFWDRDGAGFFFTTSDHESLIARIKETQDNATPSGNSLAIMSLLKLARLTGRSDYEEKAILTLEMMSGQLERAPISAGLSLMALDFLLGPTHEIVYVHGVAETTGNPTFLEQIHQRFVPNKVIHLRPAQISDVQLPVSIRDVLIGKTAVSDEPTAYLCQQGVCGPPVIGAAALSDAIARL